MRPDLPLTSDVNCPYHHGLGDLSSVQVLPVQFWTRVALYKITAGRLHLLSVVRWIAMLSIRALGHVSTR